MSTSTVSSVAGSVLRAADTNIGVATSLLKKAIDSDKNLVQTLLPTPAPTNGALDIRA